MTQAEIDARRHGHAIEVRLCAEDPAAGFLPQTGRVLTWHTPSGDGLRADHCLIEGGVISPFYDSLQGKLMAWGETRLQAIQKLIAMLGDTALLGLASNRDFLIELLSQPEFQGPGVTTGFIADQYPAERIKALGEPDHVHQALAAALMVESDALALQKANDLDASLLSWHSANTAPLVMKLARGEKTAVLEVECLPNREYRTDIITTQEEEDEAARSVRLLSIDGSRVSYVSEGRRLQAHFARNGSQLWLSTPTCTACYEDVTYQPEQGAEAGSDGRILAPIDGKVMTVSVVPDQVVAKGELLLVLEAMKMEFRLQAPVAGTVELVNAGVGARVALRQLIVQITPDEVPAE